MSEVSTTVEDNSSDATQDPISTTDQQTADNSDNLDNGQNQDQSLEAESQEAESQEAPAYQFDDDLDDWIAKRGLQAETEEQKQSLQELRNEQREFTRQRQAEKESQNVRALGEELHSMRPEADSEDDFEDPLESKVNALERQLSIESSTRMQTEFYIANKVTDEEHQAIISILKEKVTTPKTQADQKRAFDYWSSPAALPDLLDIAKGRLAAGIDTSVAFDEGARKERERIAKESQATSPPRGAKTYTSGAKTPEQERLERFSKWD